MDSFQRHEKMVWESFRKYKKGLGKGDIVTNSVWRECRKRAVLVTGLLISTASVVSLGNHLEPIGWRSYAIAVLIITALCYLPSLQNALVNWDDDPNITENPNLERIGNGASWGETIVNIFDIKKGAVIGNYNPLPILTFGIEKAIAGDFNTTLIHFTNMVLHLL
ncbi:MAG: hypothetical protein EBZ49_14765, partial [Proteobacteria bacterium]|nr:hypothetical protein [Pseudomonadota bacterium]